jgi:hypothetical protein
MFTLNDSLDFVGVLEKSYKRSVDSPDFPLTKIRDYSRHEPFEFAGPKNPARYPGKVKIDFCKPRDLHLDGRRNSCLR